MVSVEEVMVFSGYSIVWSLFAGATKRVEEHFAEGGKGNWSTWGVMDWAHGTLVGGAEVGGNLKRLEKQVEVQKEKLRKSSRRRWRAGSSDDE